MRQSISDYLQTKFCTFLQWLSNSQILNAIQNNLILQKHWIDLKRLNASYFVFKYSDKYRFKRTFQDFVWFELGFGLQNKYLYCRWKNCFLRLNRLKIQNYSITDLDLWFLSEDTSSIYIRYYSFIIIRWLAKTSHCAVWNMTDM